MRSERKAMLNLIAAGRMTAVDVLRLENCWQAQSEELREARREWLGIFALCALAVLFQWSQSASGHTLSHSLVATLQKILGGVR